METPTSAEVRLEDSLAPTTRRVRTGLLASSVLGLIMEKTGLVPNRIAGLDIEFGPERRGFIVLIALGAVAYFWISFLVYALSDFSKRRIALRNALLPQRAIENRRLFGDIEARATDSVASPEDTALREAAAHARFQDAIQTARERYLRPYWQMATPLGWLRDLLEFAFPIIFGGYIIFLLAKLASAI